MKLFRIQENVPDVYARKSRDFQLLCNIFDCVNSAVKYDIDSMIDILDTDYISDRLLPLLQTKLGFITDIRITNEQLRIILSGFCSAVKYKGSRLGIYKAIQLFLKINNCNRGSRIYITNKDTTVDDNGFYSILDGVYIVELAVESELLDIRILNEILKFIIPAGYRLKFSFYESTSNIDQIEYEDEISICIVDPETNSSIRGYHEELDAINYLNAGSSYIALVNKPLDWSTHYTKYFEKDDHGNFVRISQESEPRFVTRKYYTTACYHHTNRVSTTSVFKFSSTAETEDSTVVKQNSFEKIDLW